MGVGVAVIISQCRVSSDVQQLVTEDMTDTGLPLVRARHVYITCHM